MNPEIELMQRKIVEFNAYTTVNIRLTERLRLAVEVRDATPGMHNGNILDLKNALSVVEVANLEVVLAYQPLVIIHDESIRSFMDKYGLDFEEVPTFDGKGLSVISSKYPVGADPTERAFYLRVGKNLLEKRVVALADAKKTERDREMYPHITNVYHGKPLRIRE